jgi:hypothetical protein
LEHKGDVGRFYGQSNEEGEREDDYVGSMQQTIRRARTKPGKERKSQG